MGQISSASPGPNDEAPPVTGGLLKKLIPSLLITLFWCGITGVFAGYAGYSIAKNLYAQRHFRTAPGVVISSEVGSDTDSENTTYYPILRYSYQVDGKEYSGDRYVFGQISVSDCTNANAIVAAHPRGGKIAVYYNPADPAESVLNPTIPGFIWFLVLFLQPFLLVGLGLIVWTLTVPWQHARMQRFLTGEPALPCRIPSWGIAREMADGIEIRKSSSLTALVGLFVLGYGVACFVAVFVEAFAFHTFGNMRPELVGRILLIAVGVGVVAMILKLFSRRGAVVVVDTYRGRLTVVSRVREEEIDFKAIERWQLRQIHYLHGVKVNDQTLHYLLLEAMGRDGKAVPVHAFVPQRGNEAEITAIARRCQQFLAQATAGTVETTIAGEPPSEEETPHNIGEAVTGLAEVIRDWRKNPSYADLT